MKVQREQGFQCVQNQNVPFQPENSQATYFCTVAELLHTMLIIRIQGSEKEINVVFADF